MNCWKCGAQAVEGVCAMCGCRQGTRAEALTPQGRALRYVYDKFGPRRVLTEEGLLLRCFGDMLPDEPELRQALAAAMNAGAGREFFAALEQNRPVDEVVCKGLMHTLRAARLAEDDARAVVVCLLDMAGCGIPPSYLPRGTARPGADRPEPTPPGPNRPDPPRPAAAEIPRPRADSQPERSRHAPPADRVLAALYAVTLMDATHGLNYTGKGNNGRRGVLFLRPDGVALHAYEHLVALGRQRAYHAEPDIFIPIQAIDRLIIHDSGLSYDFTLALRDGVRFQALSATYGFNRKEAKAFTAALEDMLRQRG